MTLPLPTAAEQALMSHISSCFKCKNLVDCEVAYELAAQIGKEMLEKSKDKA